MLVLPVLFQHIYYVCVLVTPATQISVQPHRSAIKFTPGIYINNSNFGLVFSIEFFFSNILKLIRHSTRDNREMNMKCRSNESKKEAIKGMKSEAEERFYINYIIFGSLHECLS